MIYPICAESAVKHQANKQLACERCFWVDIFKRTRVHHFLVIILAVSLCCNVCFVNTLMVHFTFYGKRREGYLHKYYVCITRVVG